MANFFKNLQSYRAQAEKVTPQEFAKIPQGQGKSFPEGLAIPDVRFHKVVAEPVSPEELAAIRKSLPKEMSDHVIQSEASKPGSTWAEDGRTTPTSSVSSHAFTAPFAMPSSAGSSPTASDQTPTFPGFPADPNVSNRASSSPPPLTPTLAAGPSVEAASPTPHTPFTGLNRFMPPPTPSSAASSRAASSASNGTPWRPGRHLQLDLASPAPTHQTAIAPPTAATYGAAPVSRPQAPHHIDNRPPADADPLSYQMALARRLADTAAGKAPPIAPGPWRRPLERATAKAAASRFAPPPAPGATTPKLDPWHGPNAHAYSNAMTTAPEVSAAKQANAATAVASRIAPPPTPAAATVPKVGPWHGPNKATSDAAASKAAGPVAA